jgi:hypothetical protein
MAKRVYPIYIRIAKKESYRTQSFSVSASPKKLNSPIYKDTYSKKPLPTLQFKINVEIDDKEFDEVKKILELKLENLEPAIELKEEIKEDETKDKD